MKTKKATLVRIILGQGSFFLKKLKRADIDILKRTTRYSHYQNYSVFYSQQVISFGLKKQPAAIVKTEIEVFVKNID